MTKQEIIDQRVNSLIDRIESRGLKWSATIKGSNKQDYVIPEQESKEAFRALLVDIITEIVEHEQG